MPTRLTINAGAPYLPARRQLTRIGRFVFTKVPVPPVPGVDKLTHTTQCTALLLIILRIFLNLAWSWHKAARSTTPGTAVLVSGFRVPVGIHRQPTAQPSEKPESIPNLLTGTPFTDASDLLGHQTWAGRAEPRHAKPAYALYSTGEDAEASPACAAGLKGQINRAPTHLFPHSRDLGWVPRHSPPSTLATAFATSIDVRNNAARLNRGGTAVKKRYM
ncbi:hypothetical protein BD779DRAFT_1475165 [Infundibulicybe gibba]|nr:hypothetical protein BD779DRAFT_1475165 [Infundibulicybe gibba]